MPGWEIALRLAAGVVLVGLNAMFVLTEFALTRARSIGEQSFQETAALRRAWKMTSELEIYLTGCQLGISTTSVLLGVLAEPGVSALLRPLGELVGLTGNTLSVTSVVVAVVLMNLIHKIWGEQAPTYFGVEEPVKAARVGANFLYVWTKALKPLVMAGDGIAKWTLRLFGIEVTRSWVEEEEGADSHADSDASSDSRARASSYGELRQAFDELMVERHIPADRRREVIGALDIDVISVGEVMVPREEVVSLAGDGPFAEAIAKIAASKKTRYPVTVDGEVAGVVYTPALFASLDDLQAGKTSLAELMVDPVRVDADLDLGELIDTLQAHQQEMALVDGDRGDLVGIITVTDAFETIAGEIEDPHDDDHREAA